MCIRDSVNCVTTAASIAPLAIQEMQLFMEKWEMFNEAISLFDIRQRYREIGLRKVNGAQAKDIYPLLIKKYLSVMGVATLLSICLLYTSSA